MQSAIEIDQSPGLISKIDDAALVQQTLNGNMTAFDMLVERHYGLVFTVSVSRLRDRDTAEDIVQDTFLRAYANLAGLKSPKYFSTWLVRIARNLATDAMRSLISRNARVVPMGELSGDFSDRKNLEQIARMNRRQEEELLFAALEKLTSLQREIVMLHYGEDWSITQIAERLNIHRSTASRQLDKAVRCLRGDLEPLLRSGCARVKANPAKIMKATAAIAAFAGLPTTVRAAALPELALPASLSGFITKAGTAGAVKSAAAAAGGIVLMGKKIAALAALIAVAVSGTYVYQKQSTAPVAAPLAQAEMTITDGSVGPVKLNMSKEDVLKVLGKPDEDEGGTLKYFSRGMELFLTRKGVQKIFAHVRTPDAERRGFNNYDGFMGATDKGIRVGLRKEEVASAYGQAPDRKTLGVEENWHYPGMGITFTFDKNGSVRVIGIHQKAP